MYMPHAQDDLSPLRRYTSKPRHLPVQRLPLFIYTNVKPFTLVVFFY